MGVLFNNIEKDQLKPGDHIYSYRVAYLYAHHETNATLVSAFSLSLVFDTNPGIYVSDEKVIHFTRRGQEIGTGTVLDQVILSCSPSHKNPCPRCGDQSNLDGVISSCLDCFLSGGDLYRFEYQVNPAIFVMKVRGGCCTLASSDPPKEVLYRAHFLLENGFGSYDIFKNNCEDFAIYCKTLLLIVTNLSVGRSGQITSFLSASTSILASPLRFFTTSLPGLAAVGCGMYCVSKLASDIGVRPDVRKVPVENLVCRAVVVPEVLTNVHED